MPFVRRQRMLQTHETTLSHCALTIAASAAPIDAAAGAAAPGHGGSIGAVVLPL